MTVCLDTARGRVCYSSDAVYTHRNLDEDMPLGLALDAFEAVESFEKIRRILRGGRPIPGHEPRLFERPRGAGPAPRLRARDRGGRVGAPGPLPGGGTPV
jgi:hypothetical protein